MLNFFARKVEGYFYYYLILENNLRQWAIYDFSEIDMLVQDHNNLFKLLTECTSAVWSSAGWWLPLAVPWLCVLQYAPYYYLLSQDYRIKKNPTPLWEMDTEMSITDIENGCAISKWQIDTAISTSNMGNGSCSSSVILDFWEIHSRFRKYWRYCPSRHLYFVRFFFFSEQFGCFAS